MFVEERMCFVLKIKEHIKANLASSFFRLKLIIKDEYIHSFGLGILIFALLFSVALFRKVNGFDETLWMLRIFFAGLIASLIMFLFREVYLFWFKRIEIPGVVQNVSAGFLLKDFYKSYAPASFKKLVGKVMSVWNKVDNSYKSTRFCKYVDSLDMNYVGWGFIFCLCFL